MRKKLLIVIPTLSMGGSETIVYNLIRYLPSQEYSFVVASFSDGPLHQLLSDKGCTVYIIKKKPGVDLRVTYKIFRIIKQNKISIVNTHHFMPLFYTYLAARATKKPLFHVEHSKWEIGRLNPLLRKFFAHMITRTNGCVAVSNELYEYLLERFVPKQRLAKIINGIPTGEFQITTDRAGKRRELGFSEKEIIIGCVGNLRSEKNHEMLLRAFKYVAMECNTVRILIIGDGPQRQTLRSLAQSLGIEQYVTFAGMRLDVHELYFIMDVYCLTSFHEGLPLSILEAMATGVPVIGTNVMGIREVIANGENGLLVDLNNDRQLADLLLKVINEPSCFELLIKNAREKVHRCFSFENTARQYDELFQERN